MIIYILIKAAATIRNFTVSLCQLIIMFLCNLNVLEQVLLCWRVWERASTMVWQMGLQSLDLLIRESHPSRAFNMRQLYNGDIVNKILTICQVKYLFLAQIKTLNNYSMLFLI